MEYRGFRDLIVYKVSFKTAVEIFDLSKTFPREERYDLVDQIRRSSRSVPANIAEAWYKRRYEKAFVNKLTDAAGEAGETEVWLDFSLCHEYIPNTKYEYFIGKYSEIGKMLSSMMNNPGKFCH